MSPALAIPLFLVSLLVTLLAAASFARRLDRVGHRLGFPEALLGLLTALAADAPELSSAVVALARGSKGVGLGVVVGSNAFNLAAMIGLSALLAGCVSLRRETLVLEGGVGLAATLVAILLVARVLPATAAAALLAVVLIPYLAVLVAGRRLRPGLLRRALGEEHRARHTTAVEHAKWVTELLILPVIALIVAGSTGMVEAALELAKRWSVPQVLVGTLVLATLTSLPNAFTAVRLGLARRGSALVSETLNSNTINLVGAVVIPALAISLSPFTGLLAFDLAWLVGMTAVQLALLASPKGCGRTGGGLVIALYAVFVGVQFAYG